MHISPETKSLILEDLEKPGADIRRVSKAYGIPQRLIEEFTGPTRSISMFTEKFGGFGRPELQGFIISRMRAGGMWPMADNQTIKNAHARYDAGLTEMCQGRDGSWILLYSIPRTVVDPDRRPYFSRDFGNE